MGNAEKSVNLYCTFQDVLRLNGQEWDMKIAFQISCLDLADKTGHSNMVIILK
jgi:hypothetical protein